LYPVNSSTFNDSLSLNFDWGNSANATSYVIEIANDINFSSYLQFDSTLSVSNYRNSVPFSPATYFWRVTAHNSYGFSVRSLVWQFTVTESPSLPAPELLSPGDGFTSISPRLTFDWTEPVGANRYAIEIDSDTLFSPPIIRDTTLVLSQYHNLDSLPNAEYFWRVKAHGDLGWSAYSERWSFTVAVDTGTTVQYTIGDVNHTGGVNGIDVVYFVNYLKGGPPPPLQINGFYPEPDANGNCQVNGIDVSYMVLYFKGGSPLIDGHCLR
jgi:hypothetical protein